MELTFAVATAAASRPALISVLPSGDESCSVNMTSLLLSVSPGSSAEESLFLAAEKLAVARAAAAAAAAATASPESCRGRDAALPRPLAGAAVCDERVRLLSITGGVSPVILGSRSAAESYSTLASSLCVLRDTVNEGVVVDGRGWAEAEGENGKWTAVVSA